MIDLLVSVEVFGAKGQNWNEDFWKKKQMATCSLVLFQLDGEKIKKT